MKNRRLKLSLRGLYQVSTPRIYVKKDSWWLNWAQIYRQGLAAIAKLCPLMLYMLQGKATDWVAKPPALCSCPMSILYIEVPRIILQPIGLKPSLSNQSRTAISLFASLLPMPTNQTVLFGSIKLCRFGVLQKWINQGPGLGTLSQLFICLRGAPGCLSPVCKWNCNTWASSPEPLQLS